MSNFMMMLSTDGYKTSHGPMYRKGTTQVSSNLTPRSDKIYSRGCTQFYDGKLVWVGGQSAVQELHENWERTFFSKDKGEMVAEYEDFMMMYLGRDIPTTQQMAALHDLGYLPLEFRSLPEGSLVPMGIPVLTITNTLDAFFWLVNYHETPLSTSTWKTATNATIAREYKLICEHYLKLTGSYDPFTLSVMCHDFSMRGMSGIEDAARSGIGHLTSFIGTDTLPAITYAKGYYDASGLIGISVPATEHAVTSNNILSIENEMLNGIYQFVSQEQFDIAVKMSYAKEDTRLIAEVMFVYVLITQIVPNGIVSNVSDTYDFWGMLTRGYPYLKDVIMRREGFGPQPGKLVVRPDSGDPVDVICGTIEAAFDTLQDAIDHVNDAHHTEAAEACEGSHCMGNDSYTSTVYVKDVAKYFDLTTKFDYNRHDKQYHYIDNYGDSGETNAVEVSPSAEQKGAIQIMWETFGGTITETGHKLLDSHIGLIYGDSITTKRAMKILDKLANLGFAAANVVFGVGSYTYQCNTRDTFGYAVKATNSVINGIEVPIFKDPKTDSKKKSAKGRLFVTENFELVDCVTKEKEESEDNMLKVFYRDGVFLSRVTLEQIRERLA